jgi:hypothetical protein
MKRLASRIPVFVSVWMIFAACGGDSTPGVTDPGPKKDTTTAVVQTPVSTTARINALLSQITNAQTAAGQGLSASGVPSSSAEPGYSAGASFATAPDNAAACVLDTIAVRFNCPSQTAQNGVVTTMYFQLLDSAGTPMRGFDTLKTVSVRRVSDHVGAYSSPLMTVNGPVQAVDSINNHDDMLLNASPTAPHKLNGTGLMKVVLVPVGLPVVHISAPTVTTDVGFFTDSTKHFPNSGSVSATVTSLDPRNPGPVTTTQVTSYDGTPIAKLVITLPTGAKRTCTYDMTAPNTAPSCTP